MRFNLQTVLFLIIFLVAFVFRFWQADKRYGIGSDGSRDAIVSFESARQKQLPLTGSFSSVGPITFGPWYYYYITLANFIIPSMWAPWIAVGLASWVMVLIMYKIGTHLISKSFGLILALIAAFSPAQVSAATPLQQHALIGFASSVVILILLKAIKEKYNSWLFVLWGFVLGLSFNIHFQAIELFILPFLFLIFIKKRKFLIPLLLGIFISMLPILIFELNNHWFNTKNVIDYLLIGQYRVWTSNRWLTFIGKFWPEFWSYVTGLPTLVSFFIMIISIFIISLKLKQRRLPKPFLILLLSFILEVIILRYYRGEKFFGYLQFFHPYIFVFTGYFFYLALTRLSPVLFGLIIVVYLYFALPQTLHFMQSDQLNVATATRISYLRNAYPKTKFSTYLCNIYDRDRIQAVTLMLYMNKLYDEKGMKLGINNVSCNYAAAKLLKHDIMDINNLTDAELQKSGFGLLSPKSIYDDTARWWFKEQP